MSKKDPAVLLYFDKWISSTNGMKAEFRAWYLDLMIYQYDKGKIPCDLDELAGICRVRPSEYQVFNQMVNQVLESKFTLKDGFYYNEVTSEVLRKREDFVKKRTVSSNIGVVIKIARSMKTVTEDQINFIKNFLKDKEIDEINKYKTNHMVNHLVNLYINEDVDVNEYIDITQDIKNKKGVKVQPLKNPMFEIFWELYAKKINQVKCRLKFDTLNDEQIQKILHVVPAYVKSTPDVQFRKHPMTWLNNECWNDEIILENKKNGNNYNGTSTTTTKQTYEFSLMRALGQTKAGNFTGEPPEDTEYIDVTGH